MMGSLLKINWKKLEASGRCLLLVNFRHFDSGTEETARNLGRKTRCSGQNSYRVPHQSTLSLYCSASLFGALGSVHNIRPLVNMLILNVGRAVAQAVSHRVPTTVAQIRARDSCGICGGQSGTGVGFLRVLLFLLQLIHSTNCSTITTYHPRQAQ
jgi:hypothetical protein